MSVQSKKSLKLHEIFNSSQHCAQNDLLMQKLLNIFEEEDSIVFYNEFATKFCIILREDGVPKLVDNVLQFMAIFFVNAVRLKNHEEFANYQKGQDFYRRLFEFLESGHMCVNKVIALNVAKFFGYLSDHLLTLNVLLDQKFIDDCTKIMKNQMKHRAVAVKLCAMKALSNFQDMHDVNCPIIKEIILHMCDDPCDEIRKLAIQLTLVTNATLPRIMERTNDVSECVRVAAYEALFNVHYKYLKIAHRRQVLYHGLHDSSELVRNAVCSVVVPKWLEWCKNDYSLFLKMLDVNHFAIDKITYIIMKVFASQEKKKITEALSDMLCVETKWFKEKLSPENVMFWRCALFYLCGNIGPEDDYAWKLRVFNNETEGAVLSFIPNLPYFCMAVQQLVDYIEKGKNDNEDKSWLLQEQYFILGQLFASCPMLVAHSDRCGEEHLKCLCERMLMWKKCDVHNVKPVMRAYFLTFRDQEEFTHRVALLMDGILNDTEDAKNAVLETPHSFSTFNMVKVFQIARAMLEIPSLEKLSPSMEAFVETIVEPLMDGKVQLEPSSPEAMKILAEYGVKLDHPIASALMTLGAYCVRDFFTAKGSFHRMWAALDRPELELAGVAEIFSYVSWHNIKPMLPEGDFLKRMAIYIYDRREDFAYEAVRGFSKLMIYNQIPEHFFVELLSRFVILWHTPLGKREKVKGMLAFFVRYFTRMNQKSGEQFSRCCKFVLEKMFSKSYGDAWAATDLTPANKESVMTLIINCSIPKNDDWEAYNNMVVGLCQKFVQVAGEDIPCETLLAKCLKLLDLTHSKGIFPRIMAMLPNICQNVTPKNRKAVQKLAKAVEEYSIHVSTLNGEEPADAASTRPPRRAATAAAAVVVPSSSVPMSEDEDSDMDADVEQPSEDNAEEAEKKEELELMETSVSDLNSYLDEEEDEDGGSEDAKAQSPAFSSSSDELEELEHSCPVPLFSSDEESADEKERRKRR